jgi:hypothetical protein
MVVGTFQTCYCTEFDRGCYVRVTGTVVKDSLSPSPVDLVFHSICPRNLLRDCEYNFQVTVNVVHTLSYIGLDLLSRRILVLIGDHTLGREWGSGVHNRRF